MSRRIGVLVLALACSAAEGGDVLRRWSFEYDTDGWRSDDSKVSWSMLKAQDGGWSLRAAVAFPEPATVYCRADFDVDLVGRILYHVYVPKEAPAGIKTLLFLKDKDGLWFQYLTEEPLKPGTWNAVPVDISPSSPQLRPSGHHAQWGSVAAHGMSLIGLKFFCDDKYEGPIYVDGVAAERVAADLPPLRVVNLRESAPHVGRYQKYEITFDINRDVTNPFDPDHIKIDATFEGPDGQVTVPAFYYQDFVRRLVNDREELVPIGAGVWKVRFAPVATGPHTYFLTVRHTPSRRTGGEPEEIVTGTRSFTCVESESPGFVRVSKKDPNYFELDSGAWFYPIGHNVHSPSDDTPRAVAIQRSIGADILPNHGTFSYDHLFQKMADHGENFAEIWMCTWWVGLEWLKDWRNYHGLNRYNLHSAWRLDYLVDLAGRLDLYLHLVLDNHGKASSWTDPEWEDNPYNELNGGFLRSPQEFFRNPIAKDIYRKKLRYLVARWGYSTRIAGFELWSEIDLVGDSWSFHSDPAVAAPKVQWHREMTEYLARLDPWHHLVTTHFSTNYGRIQSSLVSIPGIHYLATDIYSMPLIKYILGTAQCGNGYGKPIIVTEYGGAGPFGSPPAVLRAHLHAGLWSTYMTHTAGTPLLWWHQFIEAGDLYWNFKALAAYHKGEERRGEGLAPGTPTFAPPNAALAALSLQNTRKAYVWVYSQAAPQAMPDDLARAPVLKNVSVRLAGLAAGNYRVEVWDTFKGEVVSAVTLAVQGASLTVPLPEFRIDCALKVKPAP